ncbi:MAG: Pseudogene of ABC transporter ATP-binding protein [Methanobrevibacter sp. CfCl-M3]
MKLQNQLNPESRKSMNKVINKIKNYKTIIIITHNLEEVEKEGNVLNL